MAYEGSPERVPRDYWEYRLVNEHFRGDWFAYWRLPEEAIEMILGFRKAEAEAAALQDKRWKRDYGRPTNRPSNRHRGN